MFLVVVQAVLATFACFGLWRLLKGVMAYGRVPAWIVAGGFLARAILGQVLFWISYLRLPVGRSLQLGPGFWFFGVDAEWYYRFGAEAALAGPSAILHVSDSYKARFFIQAIAVFVSLFGTVPSVGILLNCFLYAGLVALIARLGARDGVLTFPVLVALGAVSFSPAGVLWSTQPLKDPFFLFLVLAALALSLKWHEVWTSERFGARAVALLAGCALLIAGLVYGISTIRWYFGLLFLMSCLVMFTWQMIASKRKLAAIVVNVLFFVVLVRTSAAGASTDLPPFLRDAFHFRAAPKTVVALPSQAAAMVQDAKRGFEQTPGATNILPGAALDEKKPVEEPAAPPAPVVAEKKVEKKAEPKPVPVIETPAAPAPVTETTATTAAVAVAAENVPAHVAPPSVVPPPAATQTTAEAKPAVVEPAAPQPAAVATAHEAAPAPVPETPKPVAKKRRPVEKKAEPVQPAPVQPAPVQAAPVPAPAPVTVPAAAPAPAPAPVQPPEDVAPAAPGEYVPSTFAGRMISGISATTIPRSIAQKAGLIRVGGGRGFWFFADVDTIVFDIVLVFSLVYCARRLVRTRGRLTPMFVMVMILFMVIALPLIYAISNFGTLFRHRQMIYLGLCLLPVALASRKEESKPAGEAAI